MYAGQDDENLFTIITTREIKGDSEYMNFKFLEEGKEIKSFKIIYSEVGLNNLADIYQIWEATDTEMFFIGSYITTEKEIEYANFRVNLENKTCEKYELSTENIIVKEILGDNNITAHPVCGTVLQISDELSFIKDGKIFNLEYIKYDNSFLASTNTIKKSTSPEKASIIDYKILQIDQTLKIVAEVTYKSEYDNANLISVKKAADGYILLEQGILE